MFCVNPLPDLHHNYFCKSLLRKMTYVLHFGISRSVDTPEAPTYLGLYLMHRRTVVGLLSDGR